MRTYETIYRVNGSGPFPLAMLRADQAYPLREEDCKQIEDRDWDRPDDCPAVILVHLEPGSPTWAPSEKRWAETDWRIQAILSRRAIG